MTIPNFYIGKKFQPGKVLEESSILDIAPTIADVMGIFPAPEWEGKSLIELNLRQKYSINVVAIKQENEVLIDIDPSKSLDKTMTLIVIADTQKLAKLK